MCSISDNSWTCKVEDMIGCGRQDQWMGKVEEEGKMCEEKDSMVGKADVKDPNQVYQMLEKLNEKNEMQQQVLQNQIDMLMEKIQSHVDDGSVLEQQQQQECSKQQ